MTALSKERLIKRFGPAKATRQYPAGTDHIYKGGMVTLDSTGYAVAGGSAAGITLGVCTADCDNSAGSPGDLMVEVEEGTYEFVNGADTVDVNDVGQPCYILDDQTIDETSGGGARSVAGLVVFRNSSSIVRVELGLAAYTAAVAKATATATTGMVKYTKTVLFSDLTGADTEVDFSSALPANAVVFAATMILNTAFSGGTLSAIKAELGINGGDEDCIFDNLDIFTGAASIYVPNGVRGFGDMGGSTLACHINGLVGDTYDHVSAGSVTFNVWACVPA